MKVKEALNKLEEIREEKHISMEKFAVKELDVTRATYSSWINERRQPQMDNWQKIKDYLSRN